MAIEQFQEEQTAPPPSRLRVFYGHNKSKIKIAAWFLVGIIIVTLGVVVVVKYGLPCLKEYRENARLDLKKPSSFLKNRIQDDVNPCDDFFTFACGKFINESVESLSSSNSTMKHMQNLVSRSFEKILSEPIVSSDSPALLKLKSFYSICKDKGKMIEEGNMPMLQMLRDMGGWPLIDIGRYDKVDTWEEVVGRVNRAGFESFFPFRLSLRNADNPSEIAMTLLPVLSGRKQESNDNLRLSMEQISDWLDHTKLVSRDDIDKCVDFESKLFQITKPANTSGYIVYTLKSLEDEYPRISWSKLFGYFFMDTNVRLADKDIVTFDDPNYISQVYDLLQNTTTETITNYVIWRVIEDTIEFTPFYIRNTSDDLCLRTLFSKARLVTGSVYLDNFFDHKNKEKAEFIFDNVYAQAFSYFHELQWIDDSTKHSILERLMNIKATMGSSNGHFGNESVQKFIDGWDVQRNGSILENYRNLMKSERRSNLNRLMLSQQEDQSQIPILYATVVDAGYLVSTNATFVFAALLQPPFVAHDQPMYLNFGGIGFVIAHEITHAIKLLSYCQNKDCESYDVYQSKLECTKSIYDQYLIRQLNQTLNGTKNLEENVGDFMGLTFAYRAYEQWVNERCLSEPMLPGFNLTSRQMFWVNLATSFCSYRNNDELKLFMDDDVHSPEEARINVALSNMEEFSRDFECPAGSKMNPTQKCQF